MTVDCLCGAVSVEIPQKPDFIMACNCDICRKSGARWGYFDPSSVTVSGNTEGYRRSEKVEPGSEKHFCPTCGVTTHFRLTESSVAKHGDTMMGGNLALATESELACVELRYPDGKAWSGEGEFGFVRESRIISA